MRLLSHINLTRAISPQAEGYYTAIIFVHNEEDAEGYPDNVIAAWPTETTHKIVEGINERITREGEEIDLTRFSLEYPITVEDLIDDWENVYDLWYCGFDNAARGSIIRLATGYWDRKQQECNKGCCRENGEAVEAP
jgi:hypothetical protein